MSFGDTGKHAGLGNKLKEKLHIGGGSTKSSVPASGGRAEYAPMQTAALGHEQQPGLQTISNSTYKHNQSSYTSHKVTDGAPQTQNVPGTPAPVGPQTPSRTPAEEGSRIAQRVPGAVEYEDSPSASPIAGGRASAAPLPQQPYSAGGEHAVPAAQQTRQLPPGHYDEGARNDTLEALGVNPTAVGHQEGAHHTSTGDLSSNLAAGGDINAAANQVSKNHVDRDLSEKLAGSGNSPGGPTGEAGEYAGREQRPGNPFTSEGKAASGGGHINRDLSNKMAQSGAAPGGPTGDREGLAGTKPDVTDVGLSTNGETDAGKHASEGQTTGNAQAAGQTGYLNKATEASRNAAATIGTQAQQVGQIGQQKAAEVYNTVGEKLEEYGITKENTQQKLAVAGEKAREVGQATAAQVGAQLEKHGITKDATQQKLSAAGETMKNYGLEAKDRAVEVFQQAANQEENRSLVMQILGAVALIWLAIGFSLKALVSLAIAGILAAVLSRFSRNRADHTTRDTTSSTGPRETGTTVTTSTTSSTPAYETHYPNAVNQHNTLEKM